MYFDCKLRLELIFPLPYAIILKESIRFRAEKENSFIQKIKLLGM